MSPEANTTLGGRYRLIVKLGQGGMGVVWRAHDTILDRMVAVKQVLLDAATPPNQQQELIKRMMIEAQAAAKIRHPNVVALHDIVQMNGVPWIVMEYLQAKSLQQVLEELKQQGRTMSEQQAARIGLDVLAGLRAAHKAGVIHRDIKSANILIKDDDGSAVITDFGIARVSGITPMTATGALVGSLDYMSPERVNGRNAEAPSDLWALGLVLYYAVEGRPAFTGHTIGELFAAIVAQEPQPMKKANRLRPVIGGFLVKDPAKRMTVIEASERLALAENASAGRLRPRRTSGKRASTLSPSRQQERVIAWIGVAAAVFAAGVALITALLVGPFPDVAFVHDILRVAWLPWTPVLVMAWFAAVDQWGQARLPAMAVVGAAGISLVILGLGQRDVFSSASVFLSFSAVAGALTVVMSGFAWRTSWLAAFGFALTSLGWAWTGTAWTLWDWGSPWLAVAGFAASPVWCVWLCRRLLFGAPVAPRLTLVQLHRRIAGFRWDSQVLARAAAVATMLAMLAAIVRAFSYVESVPFQPHAAEIAALVWTPSLVLATLVVASRWGLGSSGLTLAGFWGVLLVNVLEIWRLLLAIFSSDLEIAGVAWTLLEIGNAVASVAVADFTWQKSRVAAVALAISGLAWGLSTIWELRPEFWYPWLAVGHAILPGWAVWILRHLWGMSAQRHATTRRQLIP